MIKRLLSRKPAAGRAQYFSDQLSICVLVFAWGCILAKQDVLLLKTTDYMSTVINLSMTVLVILFFFFLMWLYFMNVFRRVNDIFGKCFPPLWVVLHLVPGANIFLAIFLVVTPSQKDLPEWFKF